MHPIIDLFVPYISCGPIFSINIWKKELKKEQKYVIKSKSNWWLPIPWVHYTNGKMPVNFCSSHSTNTSWRFIESNTENYTNIAICILIVHTKYRMNSSMSHRQRTGENKMNAFMIIIKTHTKGIQQYLNRS